MRLLTLLCFILGAAGFRPSPSVQQSVRSFLTTDMQEVLLRMLETRPKQHPLLASISAGLLSTLPLAALADDDYELEELPPVWVPALFAVGLLLGVGVLTGSLGDVMDEEASLGLQSGARAKKDIERSRSSYFKKK